MNRAGTTERDERDTRKIDALLDAMHARRGCHVLVDHIVNAGRGLVDGKSELGRDRRHRGRGCVAVERHVAAQEIVGIEQAE